MKSVLFHSSLHTMIRENNEQKDRKGQEAKNNGKKKGKRKGVPSPHSFPQALDRIQHQRKHTIYLSVFFFLPVPAHPIVPFPLPFPLHS